jgi:hypothetical protein
MSTSGGFLKHDLCTTFCHPNASSFSETSSCGFSMQHAYSLQLGIQQNSTLLFMASCCIPAHMSFCSGTAALWALFTFTHRDFCYSGTCMSAPWSWNVVNLAKRSNIHKLPSQSILCSTDLGTIYIQQHNWLRERSQPLL